MMLVLGVYFPYSKDFQKGGLQDPAPGMGVGGRVPLSHVKCGLFESLRMALVV